MIKIQALTKNVRMSPTKLQMVAHALVGMPANQALQTLQWVPCKSARLIGKTLKSAIANAENNFKISAEHCLIGETRIDKGITIKRFCPVSRGSAHPIRKRTSHIKIVLTAPKKGTM